MMGRSDRSRAALHARGMVAFLVPLGLVLVGPAPVRASGVGAAVLAASVVGSQPRLVQLTAASRVGEMAPEGWTHLVIKSVPRLASGDLQTLPSFASKTATTFRTVMVADVQPLGLDKQFILSRVGLAICVPAQDGRDDDVVVSSDRVDALGIKLSTIEQIVLETAESELAESRIIAFTSTFALLRSPAMLVVGGKHKKVDLYYAFCVESTTGRLRVGTWAMWPGDVKQPPPPSVIEVGPKTIYECAVDVQAKRVLGTVPYSWDFAMQKLPPGRAISIKGNKALGEAIVTVARRGGSAQAGELEKMLRKALFAGPAEAAGKATAGRHAAR